MTKPSSAVSALGRGVLAFAAAAALSLGVVGIAYADDTASSTETTVVTATSYWSAPTEATTIDDGLIKTYGVRAGSAGGDFMGVTNTNFDFTKGTNSEGQTGVGSITSLQSTDTAATYLSSATGAGLAIWATSVNESVNPYYANLYYSLVTGDTSVTTATTWMANPETSAWGDSDGTASTNASTGEATIAGLEYEPEIIFGANKYTNWANFDASDTNIGAADAADEDYNPTYVNNDATNLWTQVYTMGQLATAADELTASTGETTRYNDSDSTESAIAYEKAIRGQLLYVASQVDSGAAEEKTIAYLYAIDANGTGYFFVPEAEGLLTGDDTSTYETEEEAEEMGGNANSAETADDNYAANNSTINMGYMAVLPYVSETFDSGNEFEGGIVMKVEDIYKSNPTCTVSTGDASDILADVDVIIYNSTTNTDLSGTSGGKNSSGVSNDYNGDALSTSEVTAWAQSFGLSDDATVIAGDDFGTSSNQGLGTVSTTEDGTAPVLYCQRNYTADKDVRAAWCFSAVYPELYDGNDDATYGYWVDQIYHVNTDDVASVVQYMTNQSSDVTYDDNTEAMIEECAQIGYDWWMDTGSSDEDWSGYAYYNGSSRASYYSGNAESEEAEDTIGIFAPSSLWTEEVEAEEAANAVLAQTYWSAPTSGLDIDDNLIKTYGVRAGSAGGDFMGVTNTNFDFTKGSNNEGQTGIGSIDDLQGTYTAANYLSSATGAGLAIWATSVNESVNPYYANLYYSLVTGDDSVTTATTWMANPETSAWGDSDGTASTNASTGEATIAGLEYEPEIIFGANKYTNWANFDASDTNIGAADAADEDYNPTYVNNDATNLWTQVYTMGQLATAADEITASTGETTRYNDSDSTESAIAYEKALRGQLLYVASQVDEGVAEEKTVAYLYAIDADGTGYFFVPEAEGLLTGDDTSIYVEGSEEEEEMGGNANSADSADDNYAANNSTINMGYMAVLPYVSETFDSGNELEGGIVMKVEDIYKSNPTCTVTTSDTDALADVDVIIYNSTTNTNLSGTSGGKNSSGVNNDYNGDALSTAEVTTWAEALGLSSDAQVIAGDDFGTSTNQGLGTVATTEDGMAPVLYCQRNYTADKDVRAAWCFSVVYPELYGGNSDATYGYWVDQIYHVNTDDVASVVKYMTNQSDEVTYTEDTAAMIEECAQIGYDWWMDTGSSDEDWSGYAYYNGSSRASYYSGNAASEEEVDTIGIFAPSSLWTEQVEAEEAARAIFTDVQDSGLYYYDAVYELADAGIINGVSDTLYGVGQNMTRAQFATILYRIAGEPSTSYDAGYKDVVDGQYYTDAINWAAEEEVVTGYTNGKYGVNDELSFEDMCLIIARYANGGDSALQAAVTDAQAAEILADFADGDTVASYADNGMAWCVTEGLVTGNTDGTIVPQEDVSRERAATVVARWQGLVD